ncbi:AMMECR1 domain-containing protein [Parazoarcus communis]|uniref:AMMECR1 domain-containing protein n=1 Tax=Parazoarcus communis TaxID=41977 RepID=A0A2U8H587_9RHOO|nr:AmmeMemoRadiSam system protein A [Parazoarcus communis]AWI80971.1 AMMECR1 domain-containing protein [Parazoarcus communis]
MQANNTEQDDPGPRLLARARQAIGHHLGLAPEPADDARLAQRGACFVTLTIDGALRGCIGSIRPQRTLADDVTTNAVAAASRDPRFPPLTADEFAQVRIEVSLLSSPDFVEFTDEADLLRQITPHEDGLILFAGCRSATFLPQVWEQLPQPEHFLAALKQKAGMDPDRPVTGMMAARFSVRKWEETSREA